MDWSRISSVKVVVVGRKGKLGEVGEVAIGQM